MHVEPDGSGYDDAGAVLEAILKPGGGVLKPVIYQTMPILTSAAVSSLVSSRGRPLDRFFSSPSSSPFSSSFFDRFREVARGVRCPGILRGIQGA